MSSVRSDSSFSVLSAGAEDVMRARTGVVAEQIEQT